MKKKKIIIYVVLFVIAIAASVMALLYVIGPTYSFRLSEDSYTLTSYNRNSKSVVIPETYKGLPVTAIGNKAFYNCTGIESITIPDSVTSIGDSAFYECSSLKSITIPDGVTSIGNGAFCDCTNLTSVTIGNSVTSIGNSVFNRIRDTAKNQKNLLKRSLSRA